MRTVTRSKSRGRAGKGRRASAWPVPASRNTFPAEYFYAATDFAAAADAYVSVHGRSADSYVTCFLLSKSFELAVKAALLAHGASRREVSGLHHDLTAAVGLAAERGIEVVDPKIASTWWIEALTAAYASTELAYRERGRLSVPTPNVLRRCVHFALERAACDALRPVVRKRMLEAQPTRPGLTLECISHYR